MTEPDGPPRLLAADPDTHAHAVLAMQAGGVVGIPTETVYGIGVVPRPEALKAVIAAKHRPQEKGIVLLIDGLDQIDGLVDLSDSARRLADRFWPGALTLVLPSLRPELVPDAVSGGRDTVALRIPDHAVPRALARELGPIAVTSANRSGAAPATTVDELLAAVGSSLALVIDDGPVRGGVASTVVAVDVDGGCRVLREGATSHAAMMSVIGQG
jgi:L-threonylcarbamoyladenylate synthase